MRDFTTLKDIDYASAVAAVRAAESGLLDEQDAERIISARSMGDAYAVLSAKGIRLPENENDMLAALDGDLERAWDFIKSYAPQSRELEILLYRNDFHNLKAALKSLMMNSDPARCFILPTLLDLSALPKTVSAGKFDELPEYMREPAEDAYRALTENSDGQLAEVILDCAALKAMRDCAKEQGSEFMERFAEELCVCADIKTAYRSAAAGKREGFLEAAICGSDSLAKEPLVRAALRGTESVISHIENSPFAELAEALKESSAAFEKLCDDRITELAESAKMKAFGAEPLAAYYLAKEAEIKNLRIILVCKRLGVSEEIIRERTRRLYV